MWHNKSKLRSYGELFHAGDTITVNLDCDKGILSFCLNGGDLGLAVDGLQGMELYPAFSLYNEDDQLTLLSSSPRGSCGSGGGSSSCATLKESISWNSSSAERVLDRCV